MNTQIPIAENLPAVCSLGDRADGRPIIVIDTREKMPLRFTRMQSMRGTLQSGDYAPAGLEHLAVVERKSLDDLVGSVTRDRERFARELHRLRGFRFARVLVTASRAQIEAGAYRSKANPRAILASIDALEVRYGMPFVFAPDESEAAQLVEGWLWYFAREVTRDFDRLHKADAQRPNVISDGTT